MTILHVGSRRSADLLLSHFMFTLEVQEESLVQIEPVGRVKILEFRKHIQKGIFVENKLFYIPWLLQTLPYISFEEV